MTRPSGSSTPCPSCGNPRDSWEGGTPIGKLSRLLEPLALKSRFSVDVQWNVGSLAILAACGVAINVVIAAFQGADALGVFNQVYAVYIFASQIATGGFQLSVLKHCAHHRADRTRCGELTTSALIITTLPAGVVCGGLYLFRNAFGNVLDSPGVALGIAFSLPGLFFFALNKVLLNALNGLRRMKAFAVFQSLRFILILAGVVAIVLGGYPGSHLTLALTASETVLFMVLAGYVYKRVFWLSLPREFGGWVRTHLGFGLRAFLGGLFSEANTRVDVLMLGYFLDDRSVGIYSFAAIFAEGFSQLIHVVKRVADPVLGGYFSSGQLSEISSFSRKVRRAVYPAMAVVTVSAVGLFPVLPWLLVRDEAFSASWALFAILMGGIFLNSGYRPFNGIFLLGGRPGIHTLFVGAAVVGNIALNALMIPRFGTYGAAGTTALVIVLQALLIILLARKVFGVKL